MAGSPATFIGNVTTDPELKFLNNGTPKLTFGIAVNHYWTDQAGEKQEKTSYFNVVVWRQLAEDAAKILEKGMRLVVTGRLEQRSYEADDGKNRSVVELIADEIGASVRSLESVVRAKRAPQGESSSKPASKPKAKAAVSEDEPF